MFEEIEQGSDEWMRLRAGKFTGSRFVALTARNKKTKEKLKSFSDAVWDAVVERMTGKPQDSATSYSMQWGSEVEAFAREAYELKTGNSVIEVPFIDHPVYPFAGCSPDGLIGDDGGLEIKCPKDSAVHLERFLSGVPEEYIPQVQGCMWVTGRAWWDFASFDPRMPESHQLLIIRVERDESFIAHLEASVLEAEAEAVALLDNLMKKAA